MTPLQDEVTAGDGSSDQPLSFSRSAATKGQAITRLGAALLQHACMAGPTAAPGSCTVASALRPLGQASGRPDGYP